MIRPTLAYDPETGEIFALGMPESLDDLGVPTSLIKLGQLAPGLTEEESRVRMLKIIAEEGFGLTLL
jgi:hypothetical protein